MDAFSPASPLRVGMLGCGPVAQAAHLEACRKADGVQLYAICDVAEDLRERGSVLGKTYNPWLFKSSDVECFSEEDGQYHRPLGADAHFYRRQVEAFAACVKNDAPMQGTGIDEGIELVRALIAVARSAASGEWTHLDDVEGAL